MYIKSRIKNICIFIDSWTRVNGTLITIDGIEAESDTSGTYLTDFIPLNDNIPFTMGKGVIDNRWIKVEIAMMKC